MDDVKKAELELATRNCALNAALQGREGYGPKDVVETAQVYYDFLNGTEAAPKELNIHVTVEAGFGIHD